MENKLKSCKNLKQLLKIEVEIIKKHIDEHKWCNEIADEGDAICDFANKYAWLMREMYCGTKCERRQECELAEKFLIKELTEELKNKLST